MTSMNMFPVKAVGSSRVFIHGSFLPAGVGTDPVVNDGVGWTVAYTNVGLYTVTFNEPFNELTTFLTSLQVTTPADYTLCNGAYTAATRTVVIAAFQEAAGALAAVELSNAADGSVISFLAICRNTTVPN